MVAIAVGAECGVGGGAAEAVVVSAMARALPIAKAVILHGF